MKTLLLNFLVVGLAFVTSDIYAKGWHDNFDDGEYKSNPMWIWFNWGEANVVNEEMMMKGGLDPFETTTCWVQTNGDGMNTTDYELYIKIKITTDGQPDEDDQFHIAVRIDPDFRDNLNFYTVIATPKDNTVGIYYFPLDRVEVVNLNPAIKYDEYFWLKINVQGSNITVWAFADGSVAATNPDIVFTEAAITNPITDLIVRSNHDDDSSTVYFDDVYYNETPPLPLIISIKDVGNDQGRRVRIIWNSHPYDKTKGNTTISEYAIWRRVDDFLNLIDKRTNQISIDPFVAKMEDSYLLADGRLWDFIAKVPAHQFDQYSYIAPTLADSTAKSIYWSVFFISAYTSDSKLFFDSAPDSGYSIDNLQPQAPEGLFIEAMEGANRLNWKPNIEADFNYYAIYRGTQSGFDPGTLETYRATTIDTTFIDTAIENSVIYYYRLSAFDFSGNESEFSEEVNAVVTKIDKKPHSLIHENFIVLQNYPNPFNPETTIKYRLPKTERVTLNVYSMGGELVITLIRDAEKSAGHHFVHWNGRDNRNNPVASGLYFYHISAGKQKLTGKMIKLK